MLSAEPDSSCSRKEFEGISSIAMIVENGLFMALGGGRIYHLSFCLLRLLKKYRNVLGNIHHLPIYAFNRFNSYSDWQKIRICRKFGLISENSNIEKNPARAYQLPCTLSKEGMK